MKQNQTKKSVAFFVVLFLVLCCGIGGIVWKQGRQKESGAIQTSQVSELPDSVGSGSEQVSDAAEETSGSSEDSAESGDASAESEQDTQGSGSKAALKNQIADYGKLTDNQMEELRDLFRKGKSKVKLYCKNVKQPEKMRVYQVKDFDLHEAEAQDEVYHVLREELSRNPQKLSYQPRLVPEDALEQEDSANAMREQSTETEPYTLIFPRDGQYFLLNKHNYDTRISLKDRYSLKQKFACQRVKKLAEELTDELGIGCEPAEKKDWRIEGLTTNAENASSDTVYYQNEIQEDYYEMQVPLVLEGFPLETGFGQNPDDEDKIQAGAALTVSYSESGLLSVYGNFPYTFAPTKKNYEKLISLSEAQKSVEAYLRKKKTKVAVAGISHAEPGYVVKRENEEKEPELRPVWALYGFKQSMEGGACRYLVDAQSGETYCEEVRRW